MLKRTLMSNQILTLFSTLCLILGIAVSAEIDNQDVYVVESLQKEEIEDSNATLPQAFPNNHKTQTIKIGIANYGSTVNECAFHAYLPEYAKMQSFTMLHQGKTYTAKKSTQKKARQTMEKSKTEGGNAAVYTPKAIPDFENETQSAANTIHIQPNQQMTFDLQYKETLEDMLQFSDKIQSKARVVFDIYGSTVNDMFGEIYSPNYPSNYPDNADITWWIRVPYDKVIRVNIVDLDIEACCDRLVVYDGDSLDGQSLAILTGSIAKLTQTVFQSTRNEIIIHLSSDCSKAKSGFKATVKAVPTEQSVDNSTTCAGSTYFNHSSGSIQSPNYPSAYNPNADCSWTIQIPVEKYVVKLTLVDFHLETNYDFLYIHDGLSSNSSLIAALTGHQTGKSFLSTSTVMFLQFTSDSVGNWQGFSVNFTSAYVATNDQPTAPPNNGTACDGVEYIETILGSDMYITSPGYSSYYYGNNLFCSWLIYSQTKVHVSDIYVDLYYDGDYLAFFDGSSSSSPLLKNYTGNSYPSNFESSGPYLFVQFVTDSSGTDNGFRFDASMDVNSTSLTAYGSSDYFQSRNYPNSYYNNAYSTWTITSYYSSYYVRSQITYYDVESCCDYLHFFDGSKNTDPELSHSGLNSYVSSSGRYLFVTFTSDSSVTKTGFQVRYYYVY